MKAQEILTAGKVIGEADEKKHVAVTVKSAVKERSKGTSLISLPCDLTVQTITNPGEHHYPGSPEKKTMAVNQPCHSTQDQSAYGENVRMNTRSGKQVS